MGGRLDPSIAAVRLAVRRGCADLEPGGRVIVGCSGGPDSMALAAATVFEGRAAGWLVSALVVDHQVQDGSAAIAAEVVDRLQQLGCPAEAVAVDIGSRGGPEAAARTARYAALDARGEADNAVVLLGHTLDDQAESVLLGLARGSGNRALAGMPPARGRFRRPLLGLTRTVTAQACEAAGITVWHDPHNDDQRFTRVRVRRHVLPVLEAELGPGIAAALARTARSARDDADALDDWAHQIADSVAVCGPDGAGLDAAAMAELPAAIRRRLIHRVVVSAGAPAGDLTAGHLEAVDALITDWHGQRAIDLPGGVQALRSGGVIVVGATDR